MISSRRLRVLAIATSLARTSGGGVAFLYGLIEGLTTVEELDVAVVGPVERISARLEGVAAHSVELIDIPAGRGIVRPLTDAVAMVGAYRWGADVVHYPHDWCPPSRCPVVLTIQNIAPFHPRSAADMGLRGKALRQLTTTTASRAAAVVAVSETGKRVWDRAVPSAPVTDVIPEGFTAPDPCTYVSDSSGATPPVLPARDYVLAITGPAPYKNAKLTLSAMSRHTSNSAKATWVIAGIPKSAWHDGKQRIGVGTADRNVLLQLMAAARCVVFLSEVESFGLPALEALAMGAHPIVIEGTAMAEWLGPRCSPVPATESAVIAAIEAVLKCPDRAERACHPIPPRFDWNNIAQEYAAVYRRVAGE